MNAITKACFRLLLHIPANGKSEDEDKTCPLASVVPVVYFHCFQVLTYFLEQASTTLLGQWIHLEFWEYFKIIFTKWVPWLICLITKHPHTKPCPAVFPVDMKLERKDHSPTHQFWLKTTMEKGANHCMSCPPFMILHSVQKDTMINCTKSCWEMKEKEERFSVEPG